MVGARQLKAGFRAALALVHSLALDLDQGVMGMFKTVRTVGITCPPGPYRLGPSKLQQMEKVRAARRKKKKRKMIKSRRIGRLPYN